MLIYYRVVKNRSFGVPSVKLIRCGCGTNSDNHCTNYIIKPNQTEKWSSDLSSVYFGAGCLEKRRLDDWARIDIEMEISGNAHSGMLAWFDGGKRHVWISPSFFHSVRGEEKQKPKDIAFNDVALVCITWVIVPIRFITVTRKTGHLLVLTHVTRNEDIYYKV